jgi:hypothetical protein
MAGRWQKKDMVLPESRGKIEIALNANPELNTKRIFSNF